MVSIAEIREKLRELEEEDLPEIRKMKEDINFIQYFTELLVKGECN